MANRFGIFETVTVQNISFIMPSDFAGYSAIKTSFTSMAGKKNSVLPIHKKNYPLKTAPIKNPIIRRSPKL